MRQDTTSHSRTIFSVLSLKQRLSAVLVLAVAAVYGQTVRFNFTNIDDNAYVTENPNVQSGLTMNSVQWAFTSTEYAGFWQPLVWLSLMLDVELFGDWAGGFHLTNVLWHGANTLLLFWWLASLTGSVVRSFLCAALFAVHPAHVESVAWIAERKDVLSLFWGLVSLAAWLRYVRTGRRRWSAATFCAMAVSLMSKPTLVTLPFVLLLLDIWPLQRTPAAEPTPTSPGAKSRWWPLIREKLPLFVLSAGFSLIALFAQSQAGAMQAMSELSITDRLLNAVVSYAGYLRIIFWPVDLAVFYPHPGRSISLSAVGGSAVLLAAVSIAVWLLSRAPRGRSLLVGWLWFLGTLVPMIGIVQVGSQQMADRFLYFPLIGVSVGLVFCVPATPRGNFIGTVAGLVVIVACSGLSFGQVRHWENSVTLCEHGLSVTEENWFLHATLGAALMGSSTGEDVVQGPQSPLLQTAERHLRTAIALQPRFAPAHFNLGLLLSDYGQLESANAAYREALSLDPEYDKARYFLCINLRRLGDEEELRRQLTLLGEETE